MIHRLSSVLICTAATVAACALAPPTHAAGHIDAATVVSVSQGSFNGVQYMRVEAMFEGMTPNQRPYRVPCQIIAPVNPSEGSGLLLFDWLVRTTIFTEVGQEQADARYGMSDEFLFGTGASYTTVRSDPAGLGQKSAISDPFRPWSDGLLDTSTEFITSAGDEFDIVVDFVKAMRTDPVALQILGQVNRTAAFGYSASGYRLRGLLRLKMGKGLFDYSLVGGHGSWIQPPGWQRHQILCRGEGAHRRCRIGA